MQNLQICLVSGSKWYDRLIQKITGSKYNHCFLRFYSEEWNDWQIIDINEWGVLQIPWNGSGYIINEITAYEAPEGMTESVLKFKELIGRRYDWGGLFGGLIKMIILKTFGIKIKKPWHSKGKEFCSEYMAEHFRYVDSEHYTIRPWESSPGDIGNYSYKYLVPIKNL